MRRDAVGARRDALSISSKPIDLDDCWSSVQAPLVATCSAQIRRRQALPPNNCRASPLMQALFHDVLCGRLESVLITAKRRWQRSRRRCHSSGPPGGKCQGQFAASRKLAGSEYRAEKGPSPRLPAQMAALNWRRRHYFLDEMPTWRAAPGQTLRVAQNGSFQRIGSTPKFTRTRILAATNRHLEEEVKAGRFREDLFYRFERGRTDRAAVARAPGRHSPAGPPHLANLTQNRARLSSSVADCLETMRGPATCANCATPWNAPRCSARRSDCPRTSPAASARAPLPFAASRMRKTGGSEATPSPDATQERFQPHCHRKAWASAAALSFISCNGCELGTSSMALPRPINEKLNNKKRIRMKSLILCSTTLLAPFAYGL